MLGRNFAYMNLKVEKHPTKLGRISARTESRKKRFLGRAQRGNVFKYLSAFLNAFCSRCGENKKYHGFCLASFTTSLHLDYANPSIPTDNILWMLNLKNTTLCKINPFVKITPKKFVWNIRAHVMLFFENPTHVPLTSHPRVLQLDTRALVDFHRGNGHLGHCKTRFT